MRLAATSHEYTGLPGRDTRRSRLRRAGAVVRVLGGRVPRGPAAEVAVVLLTGVGTALAVRVLVASSEFDARDAAAAAVGPVWSAGMILLAATALLVQRRMARHTRARLAVAALAGAAAAVAMVPLMLGVHGTDQPPNTITGGDMAFRTEYVTRFADTWHLDDYTLRGLHAFYPPGWFWLAGRTAHLLGIVPWRIVGPFMTATIGVALLAAFLLWRAVLTPAGALAAAVGSSLVLPAGGGAFPIWYQGWYSSYSCFVAVVGVAWLAAAAHAVRREGSRGRLLVLAVLGAALALTYYLLFLIVLAALLALAVGTRAWRRVASLRVLAVCAAVGALTAVFWVPTLHAVLRGQATQGHYLSPELLSVRVGVGEPAALAVLAVVSVSAFCVTFGRSATRAVAVLLLALVLYQLASAAALVLVHQQFQPHRAVTMLWASFGAAVPVALDGLRGREPFGRFAIVAALIAAAAAFALGAAQGADLASGPLAVSAHTPPHLDRADAMSRAITQAAHRRPADLTVLVGFYPKRRVRRFVQPPRNPADAPHVMMVTEPYNGFLPLRARYAHPEARLASRIGVVQAAAACRSAACTTRRLARSPFGPIDAVVLLRAHGRYVLYAQEDAFPAPRLVLISFRRSAFATATWVRRDLGRLSAFVRSPRAA